MTERFVFEGEIAQIDYGRMVYHCVYLPEVIVASLPFDEYPRLRIDAEINDWPIAGAWTPSKNGYYLILSQDFLKEAGLGLGDRIEMRFTVADQAHVATCDALDGALASDQAARAVWVTLTPGKQRGLAYQVCSAKRDATRKKRAHALMETLKSGQV